MTDRELMQQALDALDLVTDLTNHDDEVYAAIDALRARLAQPEPEPVAHSVVAGALFDFMGWLTSRKERIVLSSADNASPAVEVITEFAKMRGLSLDNAKVQDWHIASPQREWQGLTDHEIVGIASLNQSNDFSFARAIETKLKEKNHD